ncbi:MAG: phenylacetate--CoA ligase family protein [Anaerolineae bacterium]|nr:phenylacetate--CoA ligase family protein [Anaerolineae bacterium]
MAHFERYLKFQGYDIAQASCDLDRISRFSRNELSDWQEKHKWMIARFHFENNPLYKRKLEKILPECWQDLPIMAKSDYQQDLPTIVSKGFRLKDLYIANTSGSSGHPFFFAKDKYAHARTWALIKQRYAWHGVSLVSKQARFYGVPLERWSYTKEMAKDRLMNRVRFPVFDLSDKMLESYTQRFKKNKFIYIYGYTNSLVLFARFLLKHKYQLNEICPTLKLCITTSEVCTQEDRRLLKEAFGVAVLNEYGASETGIISFENHQAEWIISEENLYIEMVDGNGHAVADGKPGHILVTDLHNKAFPIIRYKIGDIGTIKAETDGNKKARRKLLKLDGRENDTIILPSGRKSPGLTFYYISRSILETSGVLREFIIRQTARNEFVFDIVSDRPLNSEEEKEIQGKMNLYLEPGLNLKINRVPMIKRPNSGKIKHFYSELN